MEIFIFFVIITVFFLCGYALTDAGTKEIEYAKESLNWPKTNGHIINSNLVHSRVEVKDKNDPLYKKITYSYMPKITYIYHVDRFKYHSSVIELFSDPKTFEFTDKSEAEVFTDQLYPKGQMVDVFYDPLKPSVGVLKPGNVQHGKNSLWAGYACYGVAGFISLLVLMSTIF